MGAYAASVVLPEIAPHIRLARLPQKWVPLSWTDLVIGRSHFPAAGRVHLPGNNPVKKAPFRLTPYQVQWLLVVGFVTVGYALYLRYLAIEFSGVALACDAGLQTMLCKSRLLATYLFRHSVFGIVALIIATLHVIRPSIVLLTAGLIAAGLGVVLYNLGLSGIAIGLLILGFARPAPATA
jgi:hypothetical protein